MALQEKALEYFASINTMASRLCVDLNEATLANKQHLATLPFDEQQQLLHDTIVTPQVLLKYPQQQGDVQHTSPKYAVKMIVDDHYSYRDEHSGPFSFHTASQRDLSCAARKKPVKKVIPKYKAPAVPILPTVAIPAKPPKAVISPAVVPVVECEHHEEVVKSEEINSSVHYAGNDAEDDDDGLSSLIPKTGLDLLDNW